MDLRGVGSVAVYDNRALLEACRAGDSHAWSKVVDRYERLVYSVPIREGLSRDEAADVAQDTFAALIRSIDRITDPDRLASWLATVARRIAWRRRNTRADLVDPVEIDVVADEDVAADTTRAVWVYEAVQDLGEPCRSLVQSLFFDPDQPSYAEIALKLGRPLGSIGPLRSRCLERLRVNLEEAAG